MKNTMTKPDAGQPISTRRATPVAYSFTRRFVSFVALYILFGVATAASAATVDFKLSPELKGREQRIANQMASSLGLAEPTRSADGNFTVTLDSDAAANTAAIALRERGSVLWAQVAVTEAPLTSKAPETEYHGRM